MDSLTETASITARRQRADRGARCRNRLEDFAWRYEPHGSSLYLVGLEFSELSSFGDVAPPSADDKAVLVGMAQRLRSHGKIGRFGVKLIRNPLGLSEGQLLLETCDPATRTQYCEIGSREALPSDRSIIETTWRWRLTHGTSHPVVMQQCTAGCTPAAVEGHVLAHDQSGFDTVTEV